MIPSRRLAAALALVALVGLGQLAYVEGTFAAFTDRDDQAFARVVADVPIAGCAVAYATSAVAPAALEISGQRHWLDACAHSNRDVAITGAQNQVNRTVRAVAGVTTAPGNTLVKGTVAVPAEPYPWAYAFADYAPGGCRAAATPSYFTHPAPWSPAPGTLTTGVHYVDGDATVDATGFGGRLTLVATGKITILSSNAIVRPFLDNLTAISSASGLDAVKASASLGRVTGTLAAPAGQVHWAGAGAGFSGLLLGDTIRIAGTDGAFTARAPVAHPKC